MDLPAAAEAAAEAVANLLAERGEKAETVTRLSLLSGKEAGHENSSDQKWNGN